MEGFEAPFGCEKLVKQNEMRRDNFRAAPTAVTAAMDAKAAKRRTNKRMNERLSERTNERYVGSKGTLAVMVTIDCTQ